MTAGALAVGAVLVARQRDRAERNLAFARRVVDEMYTGVAEKLEDQPDMDDYQREILEKALEFYEGFALPQDRERETRFEAAMASLRSGAIRFRLGDSAAADAFCRRGVALLAALVSERPADSQYREALAQVHEQLSDVAYSRSDYDESVRELKEALTLWEALTHSSPRAGKHRSALARARAKLGSMLLIMPNSPSRGQRIEEAKAEFRQALETADQLVREDPEVAEYRASLALILELYAQTVQGIGRPDACESFERARRIASQLSEQDPRNTKYQYLLARSLRGEGQTQLYLGRLEGAETTLKSAIVVLEKLNEQHPQDVKIGNLLGTSYLLLDVVFPESPFGSRPDEGAQTSNSS